MTLLFSQPISRIQLARRTSLSNTTITNLIAQLIADGIVVEEDSGQAQLRRRVGRPRTALRLVPDARYALGLHIGIGTAQIAITDIFSKILTAQSCQFDIDAPAEQVLNQFADFITTTVASSGLNPQRIVGLGVGASGLVDYAHGINILAPRLSWRDVHILDILAEHLPYPIAIENNVRTMALGEALFGQGRDVNVLAYVYGRVGVGAGFVVNGEIYHGSSAGAGEIGHMIILPENGERCECGNVGCLETLVSEQALLHQAAVLARENPHGLLAQQLHAQGSTEPIERLFVAARLGDLPTRSLLEKRAEYLGIALANLVNMLNPELILLGGIFAQAEDIFLPVVQNTMRSTAFAGLGKSVGLKATSFGRQAGMVGAASLALYNFFYT